jgi:hypothetical protein
MDTKSAQGATAMVFLCRKRLIHAKSAVDLELSEKKINPGFARVPKGQVRPFLEYEEVKKGVDKGKLRILLPNGKRVIVPKTAVRRYPKEQ